MSVQVERECFECGEKAKTTVEVPHPVLKKQASVDVCNEHLDLLQGGDPGNCAFCERMPDYEFPTNGDRVGQIHLCSTHGQTILAKLEG